MIVHIEPLIIDELFLSLRKSLLELLLRMIISIAILRYKHFILFKFGEIKDRHFE